MAQQLYKGYSSFEFQRIKSFNLYDIELVKLDLLNHIYTAKGSRVMLPNFGTRIPEMVFEPLDLETVQIIQEDLQEVFDFDPRVEIVNLVVTPIFDTNSVFVRAVLNYIELLKVDTFELNIQFAK